MNKKFLILGIAILFISFLGVCSAYNQQNIDEVHYILDNTDESDLTGCCSVLYQIDDSSSMMSFRRDANLTADIFIEKIDWHGIPAIKQYKTEGEYFCQVIITNDGWMIGYGGKDDGIDNMIIENITAEMISKDFSISEEYLTQIQEIKQQYKLGHVIIKAPNGNYGIATADTVETGKIEPGHYVSIPNRYSYFRTGELTGNSDKVKDMTDLAASDMFGITRRDITTFYFHPISNLTADGNITDVYVSNDDGSLFNMNSADLVDNVYFNNTFINAEDIPIAPSYKYIGTMGFLHEHPGMYKLIILLTIIAFVGFVTLLFFIVLKIVKWIRHKR